mmetsp:Transcript_20424/g.35098  ORF Transcript_20424/g.35098 Transcript_20424/m.35098 type:complete len:140 (+) Transcript_20424:68-487(+)
MHNDVSKGALKESSDQAYMIREDFREANMTLGIDCTKVHEFHFSHLQKTRKSKAPIGSVTVTSSSSSSSSSLEESMSNVCHSYLQFAAEAFKMALNLVLEHERCCEQFTINNLPMTIAFPSSWKSPSQYRVGNVRACSI